MESPIKRVIFTLYIFSICYGQQYVNADLEGDVAILKEAIIGLQSEMNELKKVANQNNSHNTVPIGFIYVQFPNEKAPTEIWPLMTWKDVTSEYAGLFFRAEGGKAASFGQVQQDDSPRLINFRTKPAQVSGSKLYDDDWHERSLTSSEYNDEQYNDGWVIQYIGFNVTLGEVRPRNMAIRIWKRTG